MQEAIGARTGSAEPISVQVAPPEKLEPGEVLCRTLELGICGTDREILASRRPLMPEGEGFLVLGHECLARVEAVGATVKELQVGQLVVPTVRRPLRPSQIRVDMLSPGDYTERGIVMQHGFSQPLWTERPEYLLSVPETLADVAVFAEPLSIAEKAVHEALLLQRARLGEDMWRDPPPRVLITGQGPIAFAALLACVWRNWPATMIGRDARNSLRVEAARKLGARTYLTYDEADLAPSNAELDGYDLLLECTGSDDILLTASSAIAPRGVAVWLGSSRTFQAKPHDVARLMRNAVLGNHLHLGTVNAAMRDFRSALHCLTAMLAACPDLPKRLITNRLLLSEAWPHYTQRQRQSIKAVVRYE